MRQVALSEHAYGERVTHSAPHGGRSPQQPAPPSSRWDAAAPHYPTQPAEHARAASAHRPRRALAITAAIVAGLELLTAPLHAIVLFGLLSSDASPSTIGPVSGAVGVLGAVLALVAIGFAIASLVRRERATVLAGAAIGVGVAALVGALASVLQAALFAIG